MGIWTAVDWRLEESNATEFPQRWREMLQWAKDNVGTLEWARLIQNAEIQTTSFHSPHGMVPALGQRSSRRSFGNSCNGVKGCVARAPGGPGTEVGSL